MSKQPKEVLKSRDYVLVYDTEEEIKNIKIGRQTFDQINIDPGGVIVTAKGDHCDFVSRFFTSQSTIFEDPVTGSAHCSLIPFWAKNLGKSELFAMQISERIGKLNCKDNGSIVLISGLIQLELYGQHNLLIPVSISIQKYAIMNHKTTVGC